MDANAWRPSQGDPSIDGNDWRAQLSLESRQRIVNKIMQTLQRHMPISGPEGLVELKKIAVRFEEKIYTAAISQPDYLRKISLKLLTMETKSSAASVAAMPSNPADGNQNPSNPASGMQPHMHSEGQALLIPLANQSQKQQLLSQSVQNTMPSTVVQNYTNFPPVASSMTGVTQSTMSNIIGQSSSLLNTSAVPPSSVISTVEQGVQSNMFANSQRQMQARQHTAPQLHQQSQKQQQLQQQFLKLKPQQGIQHMLLPQSHVQKQQQNLLQPAQMQQPSQQSLMQISQPSGLQSSQSTLQQAQPSVMPTAQQSSLQQNLQSVLREQQESQQSAGHQQPFVHQQQPQIVQQQILSSQQQRQQLIGPQSNAITMRQNQLVGQQNGIPDIQHHQQQQQQQQRLLGQQNSLSNIQQNHASNFHQQQQQLGQQNNVSGQKLLRQQLGISNMQQQQQRSIQQILHAKVAAQQEQAQQGPSILLPLQGQQSQPQPLQQQQLMPQLKALPTQFQPQLILLHQQQPNTLHRELQHGLQTTNGLLVAQNALEEQKHLFQPQRELSEASSTSMDSTAQTGHSATVDWQEETYEKMGIVCEDLTTDGRLADSQKYVISDDDTPRGTQQEMPTMHDRLMPKPVVNDVQSTRDPIFTPNAGNKRRSKTSSTSCSRFENHARSAKDNMADAIYDLADALRYRAEIAHRPLPPPEDPYSLGKCIKALGEINDIINETFVRGCAIMKDPTNREIFLSMASHFQLPWLHFILYGDVLE